MGDNVNHSLTQPARFVKTILPTGASLSIYALAVLICNIAVFARPGAADPTYVGGAGGPVYALGLQPDGRLVVGWSGGIARLWPNGATDKTFQGSVSGGAVSCVAIQRDGRIVIGGSFGAVNGITRRGLARLNSNGALDSSFQPGTILDINAVAAQGDNKVIVGGGTSGSGFVYRINADGSPDAAFTNLANGEVYSVALQPDGQILVAGSFTTFNGVARGYFARLTADGWLDSTFGVPGATDGPVFGIEAQPDGNAVIVGRFTTVNLVSRSCIARLTSYGSVDSSFLPAAISGYLITSVTQSDGRIIAGGSFTAAGSVNLLRFSADGTIDLSFNSSVPPTSNLALQNDGRVLAGGIAGPYLMRIYGDNYPPEFTVQPTNRSVTVGTDVTLAASVNNPTPTLFQWRKDGFEIPGATGLSHIVSGAQLADSGTYCMTAYSSAGSTTSTNAVLKAGVAAGIAVQPYPVQVPLGGSTNLAVTATGVPLSYVWIKNGIALPGATNSVLTFPNVVSTDYGAYSVIVSNFLQSVTSSSVLVYPLDPVPAIVTQPQSQAAAIGNPVTFGVVASNVTSGYTWRKDGVIVSSSPSYVISAVTPAHAGNYTVVVSSSGGSVTSSVAVLTVITPPSFITQPKDCSTNLDAVVTFAASATGSAPLSYQWRKNGLDIPDATSSTLTLGNVQMEDAGSYSAYVCNPAGGVNSSNAILRVADPPLSPSAEAEPSKSVTQPNKPDAATSSPSVSQPNTKQP